MIIHVSWELLVCSFTSARVNSRPVEVAAVSSLTLFVAITSVSEFLILFSPISNETPRSIFQQITSIDSALFVLLSSLMCASEHHLTTSNVSQKAGFHSLCNQRFRSAPAIYVIIGPVFTDSTSERTNGNLCHDFYLALPRIIGSRRRRAAPIVERPVYMRVRAISTFYAREMWWLCIECFLICSSCVVFSLRRKQVEKKPFFSL